MCSLASREGKLSFPPNETSSVALTMLRCDELTLSGHRTLAPYWQVSLGADTGGALMRFYSASRNFKGQRLGTTQMVKCN